VERVVRQFGYPQYRSNFPAYGMMVAWNSRNGFFCPSLRTIF
jgi:hypothetical protein